MKRSDSIAQLAAALSKAQGEMHGAIKDSTNPHFKSSYADLASVWDAVRYPLSKNKLSVIQTATTTDKCVSIETVLAHESGEWIGDILSIPVAKWDAQGIGSAITYGRRYSLMSIAGIAPDDDDGNDAARQDQRPQQRAEPAPPKAESPVFAQWKEWIASDPNLKQINERLKELSTMSAEDKAACWRAIDKHCSSAGLIFIPASKQFTYPENEA